MDASFTETHGARTSAGGEQGEHRVTPLELFFDLVLVFAVTQVTGLMAHDPTWTGVVRGLVVLGALWYAWNAFAWLTSATDVDEGIIRLAMLAAMGAMLVTALAVPGAFGSDGLLFGVSYLTVRTLHLLLSWIVSRGDADSRGALLRFAPTALAAGIILVVGGFLHPGARLVVWMTALAVDYLGPAVIGIGAGWRVAAEHFAERYGLIIIIALGESIIAIGIGAGAHPSGGLILAAVLGVIVVSALWWLYFDVAAVFARNRLVAANGVERARLARDAYGYLHFPMVAGIVLFAFGLEVTLHDVGHQLGLVPATALLGGVALYLLGHIAFLFRATHYIFRRRTLAAVFLIALIPVAVWPPSMGALALVAVTCWGVVAYEAVRYREERIGLRHPELRT